MINEKPEFVKIEMPQLYGFDVEAEEREKYCQISKSKMSNKEHLWWQSKIISIKFPPEMLQLLSNTNIHQMLMRKYLMGERESIPNLTEAIVNGKTILEDMITTKLCIDRTLIQFFKELEVDQFLIQGFDGFTIFQNSSGKYIVQATPAGFFTTFDYTDHPTWRNKIKYYSYHNDPAYERHLDKSTANEYTHNSVRMFKGFPVLITYIGTKKIAFCCSGLIRSLIRDFHPGEFPFNMNKFLRNANRLFSGNKIILKHMLKMAYDKEASIEVILPTEDEKYTRILRIQNYHQKSESPKPIEYDHFRYNGKQSYWKWNLVEVMNY